tara:strand:- start:48 stop:242 length:195 start_codon:yes stop_codon:yes gene_type:complete
MNRSDREQALLQFKANLERIDGEMKKLTEQRVVVVAAIEGIESFLAAQDAPNGQVPAPGALEEA